MGYEKGLNANSDKTNNFFVSECMTEVISDYGNDTSNKNICFDKGEIWVYVKQYHSFSIKNIIICIDKIFVNP